MTMFLCHVHMIKDEVIKNIDVNSLLKFFFYICLKQSVLNSVAVARKSHLKTGDKPQKKGKKEKY